MKLVFIKILKNIDTFHLTLHVACSFASKLQTTFIESSNWYVHQMLALMQQFQQIFVLENVISTSSICVRGDTNTCEQ